MAAVSLSSSVAVLGLVKRTAGRLMDSGVLDVAATEALASCESLNSQAAGVEQEHVHFSSLPIAAWVLIVATPTSPRYWKKKTTQ